MSVPFSQYLQDMRNNNNFTQQQVIDHLLGVDIAFAKLDITTYSRWERGITAPKLAKQLMVVRAFGGDITELMPAATDNSKSVLESESGINDIDAPYAIGEKLVANTLSPSAASSQLISRILSFTKHYLGLEVSQELLANPNIMLSTITDETGYLLAHALYSFVPIDTPDDKLEPACNKDFPFTTLENSQGQALSLYAISAYSSLPSTRLAQLMNILYIMKKNPEVKYFIFNCHKHSAYSLYEAYTEVEILSKGERVNKGGVKIFGKSYRYVRVKITAESLLASKILSHLRPTPLLETFKG